MARTTSAATRARISHTRRVRLGHLHTGVLESTQRVSGVKVTKRGASSTADLPTVIMNMLARSENPAHQRLASSMKTNRYNRFGQGR